MQNTKKIALYGVFAALAMILSYVEMQIPAFFAVPGMKLGLTNVVVISALYLMGSKSAFFINVVRIVVIAILFGNAMGFAFSIVGGVSSTLLMIFLKKTDKFSIIGVSMAGGIMHNIGQIIVAIAVLNTRAILWYLPALWAFGIASGAVIGLIGALVCKRIVIKV